MSFLAFFLQTVPPEVAPVSAVGLAGLLFYFYRTDRKHSEERYAELAKDFRELIQHNTAALVGLKDSLNGRK
ncbi:MAG: hypothetical protein FJ290_31380 [Planctomycetes bacterium]|nr:hypothetical protein [Planctomycetota bacterium]